jgi:AcrR family transcriptional regulator
MANKTLNSEDQGETKEKIKQAASKLFALKGFDGASMRNIAKDADVSLASINYHFRSKQELYNEILVSSHENFTKIINGTLSEEDGFLESVDKIYTIASQNADQLRNVHSMLTNPTAFDESTIDKMKATYMTPPAFLHLSSKATIETGENSRPDLIFWVVNNAVLYVYNWIIWTHKDSLAGHIHAQHNVSPDQVRLMIQTHCKALLAHCKTSENIPKLIDFDATMQK